MYTVQRNLASPSVFHNFHLGHQSGNANDRLFLVPNRISSSNRNLLLNPAMYLNLFTLLRMDKMLKTSRHMREPNSCTSFYARDPGVQGLWAAETSGAY